MRVPGAISPPGSLGSWCHRRRQRPTAGGPSFTHLCAQNTQAMRGHFRAICKQITCKTPDSRRAGRSSAAQDKATRSLWICFLFAVNLLLLTADVPGARGPQTQGTRCESIAEAGMSAGGQQLSLCSVQRDSVWTQSRNDFQMAWKES